MASQSDTVRDVFERMSSWQKNKVYVSIGTVLETLDFLDSDQKRCFSILLRGALDEAIKK